MNTEIMAGLIGRTDFARQERLLNLYDVVHRSSDTTVNLNWPSWHDQQRDLNDLDLDQGPKTLIPLSKQLGEHSQLIRAGVPVMSESSFRSLVMPTLNRSSEATWGGSSTDLGSDVITASTPSPKRLSAFIKVSDQLTHQNELLTGAFIENQLLSAVGRALDNAAITGTGVGDIPTGILSDLDVLSYTRAAAGINSLDDLVAMEKAIADANGEDGAADYLWITDTATRATLRETPAFSSGTSYGGPIWENPGPLLGHDALASVHAPADTLILAQKSAMAFLDWNRLTVERLTTRAEALEGFRTLLVTGWFDVAILDANGIISAVDA